ncbi:phosphoribosylanthranilate isomerase [Archaeoglobales archaeon]|nr:MAG: phosphoribosylanthranilate isomerase [Archaeoglobales archaeon]
MVKIKIDFLKVCGVKDEEELKLVERYADATGVVVSNSKRRVSLNTAREIIESANIPVFVVSTSSSFEEWGRVIEKTNAEYIQIHTDSISPKEVERIKTEFGVYTMKAFRIPKSSKDFVKDADGIIGKIEMYEVDRILLDTGKGSGKTHDHRISRIIARKFDVVLAGGLTPENVCEIVKFVKPHGLDVSSGVERNGRKDKELIAKFVKLAKFGVWNAEGHL